MRKSRKQEPSTDLESAWSQQTEALHKAHREADYRVYRGFACVSFAMFVLHLTINIVRHKSELPFISLSSAILFGTLMALQKIKRTPLSLFLLGLAIVVVMVLIGALDVLFRNLMSRF